MSPPKAIKPLTLAQGQRQTMKLQVLLTQGKITQEEHDKAIRDLLDQYISQPTSQRR